MADPVAAVTIPLTVHAPGAAVTEIGRVTIPLHTETGEARNGTVPVWLRCGEPTVTIDGPVDCGHDADPWTLDVWAEAPYALDPTVVGELTSCRRCRPELFID